MGNIPTNNTPLGPKMTRGSLQKSLEVFLGFSLKLLSVNTDKLDLLQAHFLPQTNYEAKCVKWGEYKSNNSTLAPNRVH